MKCNSRVPAWIIALACLSLVACARANAQTSPADSPAATVYVTKTGAKYHTADCTSLSKSKTPISLADAVASGYEPCSLCDPPRIAGTNADTTGAAVPGSKPSATTGAPKGTASSTAKSASASARFPMTITGKVIAVADGDTITVLVGTDEYKIRLDAIDCPEKKQPYGQQAKERMSDFVFGKTVSVAISGQDRYERYLGTVTVDGLDVNRAMIRDGYAWHYRQYSKDATLDELEASARRARLGLWKDAHPIPPWDFRK
jgi:micrococcal nuclease